MATRVDATRSELQRGKSQKQKVGKALRDDGLANAMRRAARDG
jgi:hypothetical protein